MGENLIIGLVTMSVCLSIQCLIVAILLKIFLYLEIRQMIKTTLMGATSLLIAIMLILFVGNLMQMTLWGVLFVTIGEFNDFNTAIYHSIINFTTLGYGDVVMSEKRRILGALEAANGVMMFGLTTSLLFFVLHDIANEGYKRLLREVKLSE